MSTVRQHLGLLWLMRDSAEGREVVSDRRWIAQASLLVATHLDELISLAGGADIEEWVRSEFTEVPAEFPHKIAAVTPAARTPASVGSEAKGEAAADVDPELVSKFKLNWQENIVPLLKQARGIPDRDDLTVWKQRALEAEEACQSLVAAMNGADAGTREVCQEAANKLRVYVGIYTGDKQAFRLIDELSNIAAAPERSGKAADVRNAALEEAAQKAELLFWVKTDGMEISNAIRALKSTPAGNSSAAPSDAKVDEIVTALYRRFKDWSKRGFGPDDVTWCEVKADVISLLALAAPAPTGKSLSVPEAKGGAQ